MKFIGKKHEIMRSKFFWILVVSLLFVACGHKNDIERAEVQLGQLYDNILDMDYSDISIEQVDSLIDVFSVAGEHRSEAICRLVKGAKLYADNDGATAIAELKYAEQHISYEDAEAGRLYYYLSRVLAVDNLHQSDYYARRLVAWASDNEEGEMLAFGNKLLMNMAENLDSATYYRNIAVGMFDLVGDTLMVEKTNARFAMKFINQLEVGSVLDMILPFYQRVGYVRDADALATIYLIDERADEAYPYILKLAGVKGFEFQYYNNMAVYYSLKGDFEKSLAVYDSAFHIYQQQVEQILDEQIARVNGEYDKKLYDQQMQLQRYRTTLLVLIFILLSVLSIMLIVWLVRILLHHRQKNMQLKAENAKLEEENVELVETTNKQSRKLYAVSDICKNTYASIVLANPDMIKVISRSLFDSLKAEYPQLSNMDYTYMFLDFIGLSVKDICQMLNVQEGTYYCRRSAIKKKISTDSEQDIDELFNQFFLGKLVSE
jgi:tetratricopeptide (TPR) repeat protein